jgi:hypothetical protein
MGGFLIMTVVALAVVHPVRRASALFRLQLSLEWSTSGGLVRWRPLCSRLVA